MNPILKNGVFPIILGLIAYAAISQVSPAINLVPVGTPDYITLLVIVAVCILSSLLAGINTVGGYADDFSDSADDYTDDFSDSAHDDTDKETGTVKWFNIRKGYGFITRDQGDDIFVHFRNIQGRGRRAIEEGERVSFIVISADKGPQADRVRVI